MSLHVEDRDGVAVVRLAHGKVNALDLDLLRAITTTFEELDRGDATAVVFTGSGPAFSAGVDLWRILDGGAAYAREFLPALDAAFLAVFGIGKPTVAAINGHAIAGGAILAAACDQRVMSGGTIGVTELLVGVPFPTTALDILGYAWGQAAAQRAVLTGATLRPQEALAAGHIDQVGTASAAVARARTLAEIPADTFRLTKQQLHAGIPGPVEPRVAELWLTAVEDGRIGRYMSRTVKRS
ncbi:enoyl-CoA hydratase/isomerase family protein [Actinoplanes sp. KI2]|uniref:enoyl-CoA hydratase/isomerase family protein n=1 Tax=Actinoplanes sp. KI2 TaxID=2983315 RepID=UPI0021D57252|nr:enoyl-CoA hydratase/isomerase family protein [Actinoplanes sp. KI2]MCU7724908.1 enoyl-CoA hydratase/isomerase family protein [Actinoplanes sp. KI2]